MQQRYSTKEIAKELNIADSTARQWVKDYHIFHRKSKGNAIFDSEALNLLKVVKQLKESGRSSETIRHRLDTDIKVIVPQPELSPVLPQTETQLTDTLPASDTAKPQLSNVSDMAEIISLLQKSIKTTIETTLEKHLAEKDELNEKYAKLSFEQGKLSTQRDILLDEVNRLNEQLSVLPTPEKVLQMKNQLNAAQAMISQLQEELEQEKQKSWFKKLLGL